MAATSKPPDVVERLAILAKLGKHESGINRALGTPPERAARALFVTWAQQAGLDLSEDRVGNLFARRSGSMQGEPILVGSHLDTVPTGGAYDGAYGVAGALCALALLDQQDVKTNHDVVAVAWAGEEGSRFPLGCLGSSTFCGLTTETQALALTDEDGLTLQAALASAEGGLISGLPVRQGRAVAVYLELHVEQGPVLEDAGVSLGIVTAIAAQRRYRVTVDGRSGHAGTVPMDRRTDALCAASEMFLAIESAAKSTGDCVATVGRVVVQPGGTNVIPRRVIFSLDVRSPDESSIAHVEGALQKAIEQAKRERTVNAVVETLETRPAAPMAPPLRKAIRRAITGLGQQAMDVASGAGHDAMCLARIAPAAMIFVPSIGGLSHVGEERTSEADLRLGVEALAAAIIEVDRGL